MVFLKIGIPAFIIFTFFLIGSLSALSARTSALTSHVAQNTLPLFFGLWVISVVLIIIGLKKRSKRKKEAKKIHDNEFQELKDKVEALEKDKEKQKDS